MTGAVVTIDHALEAFLAAQRERLSERTFRNYDHVVELLRDSLNGYAYDTLGASDCARWEAAFEAGDEGAYCHLFGPDHIPAHLGGFLGYFMIRKVMAGEELLRAAGTVTKRLATWLHDEGLISAEQAADAADRGATATRELPRAERLGNLLYEEARRLPDFDPADVPDEHVIEDYLAIERVEPGALWFEGDVGPVAVPTEASDLAEPGWSVNIVLVMRHGRWRVAEVGFVYP